MDFTFLIHISIKLIVGFATLLVITNVMGKIHMNQTTLFHFISAITLGELVGNVIYDREIGVQNIIYAILFWGLLIYTTEKITLEFRKTRGFLEGTPSIVIRQGIIDYNQLKKNKMDLNELLGLLRGKDVFCIKQVDYAILETNGTLSVLKKYKYDTPTNIDLKLEEKPVFLPTSLVLDGIMLLDNIKSLGFDQSWLEKQIHKKGIERIEDIFYAEWQQDEGIYIVSYKDATSFGDNLFFS
ncbi:MAG: DUF421 domain-containing protein [Bacillota bacterium]